MKTAHFKCYKGFTNLSDFESLIGWKFTCIISQPWRFIWFCLCLIGFSAPILWLSACPINCPSPCVSPFLPVFLSVLLWNAYRLTLSSYFYLQICIPLPFFFCLSSSTICPNMSASPLVLICLAFVIVNFVSLHHPSPHVSLSLLPFFFYPQRVCVYVSVWVREKEATMCSAFQPVWSQSMGAYQDVLCCALRLSAAESRGR